MIIITNKYKYNNIKLEDTRNIVENIVQKYDGSDQIIVEVKCVAEFWDKIKNEIKIITIKSRNSNEESNKVMESSEGKMILVRIDKLRIVIKRIVL